MTQVKATVLRAAGINCDVETQYALELAGAQVQRIHVNQMIENKHLLDDCHILVFPGGFSYGDDVSAGKILSNQIIHYLYDRIAEFIRNGKLVLGICNGFQVLVKTGLLPGTSAAAKGITITNNDSEKYEDRWVYVAPQTDRCVFLDPDRQLYLPVAHAEGKVVVRDPAVLDHLKNDRHIAFKYVDQDGEEGPYPVNPNGAVESIAGLTDATGRVMGLMPHPERNIHPTHHPHWTRMGENVSCDGQCIFDNAVDYVKGSLLT